jgi:hypothetical protein
METDNTDKRTDGNDKRQELDNVRTNEEASITEIASQSFSTDAALYQVVTFLNKSLRGRGLIFGLTRERESALRVTIYEVLNSKL